MKIKILKVAQLEFHEAREFYEIERTGLGKRFEREIKEGNEPPRRKHRGILRLKQMLKRE